MWAEKNAGQDRFNRRRRNRHLSFPIYEVKALESEPVHTACMLLTEIRSRSKQNEARFGAVAAICSCARLQHLLEAYAVYGCGKTCKWSRLFHIAFDTFHSVGFLGFRRTVTALLPAEPNCITTASSNSAGPPPLAFDLGVPGGEEAAVDK